MSTFNSKIDLRRSLIRFSSTLIGLITIVGIMSLFSIWSMNRAYIKTENEIEQGRNLANEALLAQIDFKVQVQEWKNILLRGSDKSAKQHYTLAFEEREAAVEKHLSNFMAMAKSLNLQDYSQQAEQLVEQHRKLAVAYRQALKMVPDLNADSVKKIDKIVLGIDRELENQISRLSQEILELNKSQRDILIGKLSERYSTLRTLMLSIIAFSLTITGASLYASLRAARD